MWSYGSTNYYAFAREHKELLYKITKAYSDYMKAKQTYFFLRGNIHLTTIPRKELLPRL
jgi:hypothetical protein